MLPFPKMLRLSILLLPLLGSCNHPQKNLEAAAPLARPHTIAPVKPLPSLLTDTFQVRGGILRLFPITQTSFKQIAGSALSHQPDSLDSPSIVATRGRVYRKGSQLIFTLDNGHKTIVQDDTTDTDQTSTHYYWGELSKAHQWVLWVGFWEGSGALLVDQRTGQNTHIWGQPVDSPDGKHVITYSYDMAYNPTGLQLYQVNANGIQQLWERNTSWGPTAIKWLSNRSIAIEKQDMPDSPDNWIGLEIFPNI
jgi:hypothetical protein